MIPWTFQKSNSFLKCIWKIKWDLNWPGKTIFFNFIPCKKKIYHTNLHASFYVIPMNIVKLRKNMLIYVSVPKRPKYHYLKLTDQYCAKRVWNSFDCFAQTVQNLIKCCVIWVFTVSWCPIIRKLGWNRLNQVYHTAQSANACWCNKKVIVFFLRLCGR